MSSYIGYASADRIQIDAGSVDGAALALTSQAQGTVMYYNGSTWVVLAPGTSGEALKTQGAGANPVWGAVSSTGDFANGGDRKATNTPEMDLCKSLAIELLWNVGGTKIQSSSNLVNQTKWGKMIIAGHKF